MAGPNDKDASSSTQGGSGGMDQSAVVQSDGATTARRPRTVLGNELGQMFGRGRNEVPLQVSDEEARLLLWKIEDHLARLVLLFEIVTEIDTTEGPKR